MTELEDYPQDEDRRDWFEVCGCVDDGLLDDIEKVLKATATDKFFITEICKKLKMKYNYVLAILCILDNAQLTEHGSGIRGSWITPKGEEVLKKIKEL